MVYWWIPVSLGWYDKLDEVFDSGSLFVARVQRFGSARFGDNHVCMRVGCVVYTPEGECPNLHRTPVVWTTGLKRVVDIINLGIP